MIIEAFFVIAKNGNNQNVLEWVNGKPNCGTFKKRNTTKQ